MEIQISLDIKNFKQKPFGYDPGNITNRIAKYPRNITIEQLAKAVVLPYGRTWTPATFNNGKRSNNNFRNQQVFGLDVDNSLTFKEVMDRCKKYNILPSFAYSTFSSNDDECDKFRIVFCLEHIVNDFKVRNFVQLALIQIFPEGDSSVKDAARLFYGGKKLIYEDYDTLITIPNLITSLVYYIYDNDKSNNATKNIEKFCINTGLDMENGLPKIKFNSNLLDAIDINNISFIDDLENNPYIYSNYTFQKMIENYWMTEQPIDMYRTPLNPVNFDVISYHILPTKNTTIKRGGDIDSKSKEKYYLFFNPNNDFAPIEDKKGNLKMKKYNITNERVERKSLIDRFNFETLEKNCKLYRDFINNDYWAHHLELFGMATNLLCVKGGRTKFFEALNKNDNYDINKWEKHCNYIAKMNYSPQQCDNFCKYNKECNSCNMIFKVKLQRGKVNILEKPILKTLENASDELKNVFETIIKAGEVGKIYCIKAPAGIGKTENYLNVNSTTIAVPTHRLKTEVYDRMIEFGNQVEITPELPELEERHLEKIQRFYDIGAYGGATRYMNKIAKDENLIKLKNYINDMKNIENIKGNIITTHQKFVFSEFANENVIIDEDIIPNIIRYGEVLINDLESLEKNLLFDDSTNDSSRDTISSLLQIIYKSENNVVYKMPNYLMKKPKDIYNVVVGSSYISTNVLGFLICSHYIKQNNVISFVTRRSLPINKKIIITSATLNEKIYKLLFGDRVIFYDIGEVENKGKIIQYCQRSYSRWQIKNSKNNLLEDAKKIIKDNPVITYKFLSKEFNNYICNFGATVGLDEYSGKDICILGTPHISPSVYILFANCLGQEIKLDDCNCLDSEMKYVKVIHNGFEFWFQTFSQNELLREVQLYLISSELEQAVGRARILRNDCTVTVLSNYPLKQAEFRYIK